MFLLQVITKDTVERVDGRFVAVACKGKKGCHIICLAGRGGRVAEGNGLLNRHSSCRAIEGSNPSLSAQKTPSDRGFFRFDCIFLSFYVLFMILPITIYSDDILRQRAKPLKGVDDEIRSLIASMFESMHNAAGIGLAAPQVGRSIRLLVVDISVMEEYADVPPMVVINPHIVSVSGSSEYDEGCLSVPGLMGPVVRPSAITLKYRDETFAEHEERFTGMSARVLQHEIDHLDGKLFVDRLDKRERRRLQSGLTALSQGVIEAAYPVVPPSAPPASR